MMSEFPNPLPLKPKIAGLKNNKKKIIPYLEILNLPKLTDYKHGRNSYFSKLECMCKFMYCTRANRWRSRKGTALI